MKIKYQSVTGETTEIEISDDIAAFIVEDERREQASDKLHHRHCYSLDAISYEGKEYSEPDFTAKLFGVSAEQEENKEKIKTALSHLTSIQQRRILLLAKGFNIMKIAEIEGKDYKTVYESIEAAKKKFLKFYQNTP